MITAGKSTCPLCLRAWTVTPFDDCLLPACGHFGDDVSSPNCPCERCGLAHALRCPQMPKARSSRGSEAGPSDCVDQV